MEALPPEHWAYAELEHFEARGLLRLPGVRPYSRAQVRGWVATLQARRRHVGAGWTPVESQRLQRLAAEFVTGEPAGRAAQRFDVPVWRLEDAGWAFLADVELQSGAARVAGRPEDLAADGTAWGRTGIEGTLRFGNSLAYDTRYVVVLAEESGRRTGENFLSSRERNWRGLTSNNDRAYLALDRGRWRVTLGREYVAWGTQRGEELLVSDQGVSLDGLQVHLHMQRFRLASTMALLSATQDRWYAAHRLEVDWGPLRWGVQEAVVYVSSNPVVTYAFPLSYYYGNQFNERADDNVLLGFDVEAWTRAGIWNAELLVDDFIYDGDPAPNKLGVRAGWRRAWRLADTDLDTAVDYVGIGRWTYTHRNPGNAYVGGSGDLADGEPLLGNSLGPDADRIRVRVGWRPDVDWDLAFFASRIRRGEGNRQPTPWQPGEAFDVGFPSGRVEHENWAGLTVGWRPARALEILAHGALGRTFRGNEATVRAELRFDP